MYEKIPFIHRECAYNIILEDDIAFEALHHIIDELIARGSFGVSEGYADLYNIRYAGTTYTVAIDGRDVMIVVR